MGDTLLKGLNQSVLAFVPGVVSSLPELSLSYTRFCSARTILAVLHSLSRVCLCYIDPIEMSLRGVVPLRCVCSGVLLFCAAVTASVVRLLPCSSYADYFYGCVLCWSVGPETIKLNAATITANRTIMWNGCF